MKYILFFSFLIAGCTTFRISAPLHQSRADWGMTGKTPSRENVDTASSFKELPQLIWKYDAGAGFGPSSMVVIDGTLFVGTLEGELHAVRVSTGKRIGYKKFYSPISSAPVLLGDLLFVGTESGKENFNSYDVVAGVTEWSKDLGGVASCPLILNDRIYVGGLDGSFYCLDRYGTELWKYSAGHQFRATPCGGDTIVYTATLNGDVCALNAVHGTLIWKHSLGGSVMSGLTLSRGTVLVGSRDGYLYALDAVSGFLYWKADLSERIMSSVSCVDSTVFVGSLNGTVSALSLHTGAVIWQSKFKSVVNTQPLVLKDAIIVPSLDTYVYALSLSDGKPLWKFEIGSRVKTSPVVWNQLLFVAAEDRTIYCFR